MHTFKDLFVDELKDVYDAEHQLLKAIPEVAKAVSDERLKQALLEHLEQTREQIKHLESVFEELGEKPERKTCDAMKGLTKEAQGMISEGKKGDPEVLDAGLLGAAQKVEHYEMATYGTLRNFARRLGLQRSPQVFQAILNQEGMTDKRLTAIAEGWINLRAAEQEPASGGQSSRAPRAKSASRSRAGASSRSGGSTRFKTPSNRSTTAKGKSRSR